MRVFNLAEELEKERKKNKELEEKLKLAKERDLYGIKVFTNNEIYNEYKGTLQDQINELQDRINKIKKYIKETRESDSCTILPSGKITDIGYCLDALEDIEDLLNGKELKGE